MSRYVDLDERVTAQFYDQEYEEWTMRTVTVADVLDSVCDEYTVLPSTQPERKTGHWRELVGYPYRVCSECGATMYLFEPSNFCPNCGAKMKMI